MSMAPKTLKKRVASEDKSSPEGDKSKKAGKTAEAKKKPVKRPRTKVPKVVRLKAFWVVFNQGMKRVAVFEYSEQKKAQRRAEELNATQKTPHFVQLIKEPIEVPT
jgi:hypothetical protein